MEREDIRIRKAIMHVLDTQSGQCIYSENELDTGSDFCDFLRGHIWKVMESDEKKECVFEDDSEAAGWIKNLNTENFVTVSFYLANSLYGIMEENIDIPAADLFVVVYEIEREKYLAILKMNYKRSYTHQTIPGTETNVGVAIQKATLPGGTQKLSEAAIIELENRKRLYVTEKRYDVNGIKTNYFSQLFLRCRANRSEKEKLNTVQRVVEHMQQKYYCEGSGQVKRQIEAAIAMDHALEETGKIEIRDIIKRILENEEMQQEAREKLERYGIENDRIEPKNESTKKRISFQTLKTDTGIEIRIPTQEFERDSIQLMDCEDGTIQMLIGNFERIEKR